MVDVRDYQSKRPTILYGVGESLSGDPGSGIRRAVKVFDMFPDADFILFTYGDDYEYFFSGDADGDPMDFPDARLNVVAIPINGIKKQYTEGQFSLLKTIWRNLKFPWRMEKSIGMICTIAEGTKADLIISDMEPASARAARITGIPLIAIGQDQEFATCKCPEVFSRRIKRQWRLRGMFVRHLVPTPSTTIVTSSIHHQYLKLRRKSAALENVVICPPLQDLSLMDEGVETGGMDYTNFHARAEILRYLP